MVALTIGMATYDDFDGVYFTIQALRLYHDLSDTEILVVDNFGCEATRNFVENWAKGRYILAKDTVGTAASRDLLFREGRGDAVLCCDSHVLFERGVIAKLKAYHRANPESIDLLQGPLVNDDGKTFSTHFDPVWREQMWGIWGTDDRGTNPDSEPFDIPMQGLGAFSCRRATWPGFNTSFRGFGGEEGYIHEKFRRAGGRTLCAPWFRWLHRFGRPRGVPYPLRVEDKLRNYVIGHSELGLDLMPVLTHFSEFVPQDRVISYAADVLREVTGVSLAPIPQTMEVPKGELPLVSCICMTYNRPPHHQYLIEEAVESFLRQTYPNKEMILINDCAEQEILCDASGVRVFNMAGRFPTLGDKHNAAIRLSSGDLIAPWDDDDISLPWRLARSVELLQDGHYLNPRCYWFLDNNGLHSDHAMGVSHTTSLFTRSGFEAVGGYPAISLGVDLEMDQALLKTMKPVVDFDDGRCKLPLEEWMYIYRWGVSPAHLSGRGVDSFYSEIGEHRVQPGIFRINPHWRTDYTELTRQYMASRMKN